jgi:hypothetical protein
MVIVARLALYSYISVITSLMYSHFNMKSVRCSQAFSYSVHSRFHKKAVPQGVVEYVILYTTYLL